MAYCQRWLPLLLLVLSVAGAQTAAAQVAGRATQPPRYFLADAAAARAAASSLLAPQLRQYQAYTLDLAGLRAALAAAPLRGNAAAPAITLGLPMPDGTTQHFRVWEAPLMAPALAARYPTLHTYGGQGVENPLAQLSLTVSPQTFAAQVLNADDPRGTAYVQAAVATDAAHYLSYFAQDVVLTPLNGTGGCDADRLPPVLRPAPSRRRGGPAGNDGASLIAPVGASLTVYRLYVTTTKEFTNLRSNLDVQAEVLSVLNFVRTIQERDLAITISLVGTTFYQVGADGGYNQSSDFQMLKQNQLNVNGLVAVNTYDYAHLFTTAGSGLAFGGVVGEDSPNGGGPYENPATSGSSQVNAPVKAGGVSGKAGRTVPAPDYFATSVVAHEMGHQFSATHTANAAQGSCNSNRTAGTAFEPGKGSTIMSYADVACDSPENNFIVSRADPYYHTASLEQMRTYIETIPGVGNNLASGNTPPTVSVPFNRTIPRSTPFKLTATGADVDADALRYAWEELDLGAAANLPTPQVANDNVPLFRSVLPSTSGATRFFPRLSFLNGSPSSSSSLTERLPEVARAINLRCTVRDYHGVAGAVAANTASSVVGGIAFSRTVALTVSAANATPFAVTAPNTAVTWAANSTQTVTWNGVGTKTSAVNCQTVNVRLSTDGGATYPVLLAAAVPNVDGTGSVSVTTPTFATTTAKVMLEAADNYFFDISDANFTITAAPSGPAISSLSPGSGVAGSSLTISGTGFGTNPAELSVTVGGVAATISGAVTNTSFSVIVPLTALTGNVVVTKTGTGAGTANGGVFQVTPVVLSVNPTSGAVGSSVVISGNSFGGATRVSFNGTETTAFTVNTGVSPNTITVVVPAGATSGALVVYTAGGASNEDVLFTVVPFAVASIAPAPNARSVREFDFIEATFNAAANATNSTLAPLKVSSLQAGGRKAGTTTVTGSTVSFNPGTDFRAGEVVQVSVTTAAVSAADVPLAQPYVSQFTVRSRARTGQGASTNYLTGARPEHMVAGNLNAEAALDLVVVNRTDNTVSILLNNGAGTIFTAATGSPIAVGVTPQGAALADLNNDGNLDLLVACAAGTITVLQGNGDGTFTAQPSLTGLGPVQMVAVGDLNGDGNLDLVAPVAFGNVGRAVIGLGNGGFGFTPSTYNGLALAARAVALADLNEDGKLDLASANYSNPSNPGNISVRFGDGAGSFAGGTDLLAAGAFYVVAADFTGDGYADLASTNVFGAGTPLNVWAGVGNGAFGSPSTLTLSGGGFAYTLSTGDYDGNGSIDLIAPRSGFGSGAGVDIFSYNTASGTFTPATTITAAGFGNLPRYVAVADLNNDRTLDFATANSVGADNTSVSLTTAGGLPLPVELVSFTAARTSAYAVALAWRTATELRNAGFVVERSLDGQRFAAVSGLLPGLGTSSAGRQYGHLDPEAPANILYYRLRQVDEGGAVKYSPVAVVAARSGDAAPAQLLVYPNPARLAAFVRLTGPQAPGATVRLFDALGRTVRTAPAPTVGTVLELPLRDLSAGLYVVRCGTLSQRLAVDR